MKKKKIIYFVLEHTILYNIIQKSCYFYWSIWRTQL